VNPFRIYIGYDPREKEAFDVCAYSIQKHASIPVEIIRLDRELLKKYRIYNRKETDSSTAFTYTRFLVPYLNKYKDWALFVDCDFVFTTDIAELYGNKNDEKAVMVIQHEPYVPKKTLKMDGQKQEAYPRKNWSSLILWNCAHNYNKGISPGTVNNQPGSFLHRFAWLSDEYIGSLDKYWNFLADEGQERPKSGLPKAIHYTNGGPWFKDIPECVNCEYSNVWQKYSDELNGVGVTNRFFGSLGELLYIPREEKPRLDIKEIASINQKKGCVGCQKKK
jgi:hypothetical protein